MSQRATLQKEIDELIKKIKDLEERRNRSEANLVSALLNQREPDDEDTEYFNAYTEQINALRAEVRHKQVAVYAMDLKGVLPKKRRSLFQRLFSRKKAEEDGKPGEETTNENS